MARGLRILYSNFKFRPICIALLIIAVLFWIDNQSNPRKIFVPPDPDFQKILEHLESVKLRSNYSKLVYITRMISNDLPPIHFEDQTYLNTKTILGNEELPSNFRYAYASGSILTTSFCRHCAVTPHMFSARCLSCNFLAKDFLKWSIPLIGS